MKLARQTPRAFRRAFTLIEILLAIVIITGLLAVVLYFYQQASNLRTELLLEADRISSARLLMDRITTELRCARLHSYFGTPLVGDSGSIRFITTALPATGAWSGEKLGRNTRPETDLKFVRYSTAAGMDETNSVGLTRSEEPAVELITSKGTGVMSYYEGYAATNRPAGTLLTEQLRAIRFRYWSGTAWQDSWNDAALPAAVEVTLAPNGLPDEDIFADMPEESFRRVIYLPGSTVTPSPSGIEFEDPAADAEVLP